ncbi:MAG TPA: hypothetical protein VLD37_05310 [Candidatus Bilamarchaeum sp.]|nr:hypothetical protein [Candidatus Bilamarchaeum sp.]
MEPDKLAALIPVAFFILIFGCIFGTIIMDFVAYWDFAPASGSATGYIYYQEKSGIWQLDWVCWKDTQYDYCETFDPAGRHYEPGKYTMYYECSTFVWAWEHPSECKIINATRIGDIS